jgi:MFS family permease
VAALNQTIVATAIPTICNELKSSSGYAWISAAYLLSNAIAAPIWSKTSDIWGRKLILLSAVALYFCASIICACSQSMKMLIVGRTFQGTAGGGLIQIVYATISDIYSMRSRTFYFGLVQMMWAVAGGIGPVTGGTLAQYASWRWIFWINLPITGLSFAVLLAFLDVHNPRTKLLPGLQAVDWYGSLSILSFMVLLLLGLNFGGSTFAWNSTVVICLLAFGTVMIVVFLLSEKRAQYPLIPLYIFRHPSNIAVLVIGFMHDWVSLRTFLGHSLLILVVRFLYRILPALVFPISQSCFTRAVRSPHHANYFHTSSYRHSNRPHRVQDRPIHRDPLGRCGNASTRKWPLYQFGCCISTRQNCCIRDHRSNWSRLSFSTPSHGTPGPCGSERHRIGNCYPWASEESCDIPRNSHRRGTVLRRHELAESRVSRKRTFG